MSTTSVKVTVQCRWNGRQDEAAAIAQRLNARCVEGVRVPPGEFRIVLFEHGAQLWDEHSRRQGMPIDFHGIDRRTGSGSLSHKQPIARAIGRSARTIIDATAGLGHDAFLLACLGWKVLAIERHPVIGLLLEESVRDALEDASLSEALGGRLQVQVGDAREWLLECSTDQPDVIYLDPMFEPRRSSALPRKPAQVLRRLVGSDEDAMELFEVAGDLLGSESWSSEPMMHHHWSRGSIKATVARSSGMTCILRRAALNERRDGA